VGPISPGCEADHSPAFSAEVSGGAIPPFPIRVNGVMLNRDSNKEGKPEKAQSRFVLYHLLGNQDIICTDLMASSGTKQSLVKASIYVLI
jgi:hypothetical protein